MNYNGLGGAKTAISREQKIEEDLWVSIYNNKTPSVESLTEMIKVLRIINYVM